jgi:2-amino-4-hydroxy-6-hydroxymethyldihydropteridine diphosphokinase
VSDGQGTWQPVYVGLGSNLDGPVQQIEAAFELLQNIPETSFVARSSLYRSAPFGEVEQPDFVNAAAALLTQLAASDLLAEFQKIERKRGRKRGGPRWGPRILDLDLLLYSDHVIEEPGLSVPHPGIAERNFVLLPLRDLAPDLEIPGLGRLSGISVDEQEPRITRID